MLLTVLGLENITLKTKQSMREMNFYFLSTSQDNHQPNDRKLPEKLPKGSGLPKCDMQHEIYKWLLDTLIVLIRCTLVCSEFSLDRLSTHQVENFVNPRRPFFMASITFNAEGYGREAPMVIGSLISYKMRTFHNSFLRKTSRIGKRIGCILLL